MKILLVNDYSAPVGGAEIQMLGLRRVLREKGHDVRLFSSTAVAGDSDEQCFGTTSSFRTLLQTANPWAAGRLRKVLRSFQPDVVHVTLFLTQLSPLILPLLREFPSVYYAVWYRAVCPIGTKMLPDGSVCEVRAGWVCCRNGCLPLRDWIPLSFQKHLLDRNLRVFRRITSNSEAVRARMIKEGISPVEVIAPGVSVQPQRPPLTSPRVVAFSGRLVREKGADLLMTAFAKVRQAMPESRLLIAGDGPERENLKKLAASLGISNSVEMAGHLSRENMETFLERAWVRVVPSRWPEPFGLSAVEAMMRGTAVVASNLGGLTEIVRHERTGLLIDPEVPPLSGALLKLLQDSKLAEEMGAAGRIVALEHFTEEAFAAKFLRVYQEIIAEIQRRP